MDFPQTPGIHDVEIKGQDGRARRYTVSVPGAAAERRPLVLVLHYAGTPTRFYGRPLIEYLVGPALSPHAPVLVAPESAGGPWHSEANEAFVMHLLMRASAAYAIDDGRRVVCGYSMGAIGTWHFLMHYPEHFSAALPIAGFPNQELSCPRPVHAFHSARDELFALAKLEGIVTALAAIGADISLTTADVNGHYDVNGYAPVLAQAVPWLRAVWARQDAAAA